MLPVEFTLNVYKDLTVEIKAFFMLNRRLVTISFDVSSDVADDITRFSSEGLHASLELRYTVTLGKHWCRRNNVLLYTLGKGEAKHF